MKVLGSPRCQQSARLPIENPHGRTAYRLDRERLRPLAASAVKHPDVALRVDVDSRRLPEYFARRQLWPAVHDFVALHRGCRLSLRSGSQ